MDLNHKEVLAHIQSDYLLTTDFLKIESNVRIRKPIRALSESVVKKFKELPLADERFHRPAVSSGFLPYSLDALAMSACSYER